jgi:hypothetical protein
MRFFMFARTRYTIRRAMGPALVLAGTVVGPVACGPSEGDGVTIKGDVAGLDTISARADSLIANAGKGPVQFDSIPRLPEPNETSSGDGTLSVPGRDGMVGTDAGNEMSRRAQARGDSMARAIAAQLAGANATRSRGDSVRGVLTFTGSEPARQVVLRQGDATITLSGMATTGLAKLVGTEVVVHGVQVTPRDVVVNDFVVRASNGVPAYDGTLEEGGALRLTDGSGVRRVPLPTEVRGYVGARVWVAVKNGNAVAGGVIAGR